MGAGRRTGWTGGDGRGGGANDWGGISIIRGKKMEVMKKVKSKKGGGECASETPKRCA